LVTDILRIDARLGGTPIIQVKLAAAETSAYHSPIPVASRTPNYETIIQDLLLKKVALLEHDVSANFQISALAFLSSAMDRMKRLQKCRRMDGFVREQLQDEIELLKTEVSLRQYQRQQFHIYVDTLIGMVSTHSPT